MKLATIQSATGPAWGIVDGGHLIDMRSAFPTLHAAIAAGGLGTLAGRDGPRIPLEGATYLPVVPDAGKVFCVGLNYENHRKETGRDVVENPTIFTRFARTHIGHGAPIIRPRVSTDLDFEGELAVIIGTGGRHIRRADAMAHVAGYACYNDGSVRDWQRHTMQFIPGKNFDGTGPFGPWMVTPDEMGALGPQRMQTRVNGQVVQDTTLGDMIFDVPRVIEYCSTFTALEPGDVIATGTPGGVGAKRTPPLWLKPGDIVEVEIDGVGLLRNGVVDEAAA